MTRTLHPTKPKHGLTPKKGRALSRNQQLVFDTLCATSAPLSAYTILDQLRGDGLRAPLQVYRALDALIARGMVHRLESLNAFVCCRHPSCEGHGMAAFTICEQCGAVGEVADAALTDVLEAISEKVRFTLARSTVELRGLCKACQAAAPGR